MKDDAVKDLELYDYSLPKELIAQTPKERREESRLMVLSGKDETKHDFFYNLTEYLEKGDALVVNDSKVLPARLHGRKRTGGKVELLVFDRISPRIAKTLVKGKARKGDALDLDGFKGMVKEKTGGFADIEFDADVDHIISTVGNMPLPPYIKGQFEAKDRYQTVYAENEGSVAAPTAGLHFAAGMLKDLRQKGITIAAVTLHINIGTFLPVEKSVRMPEHYNVDEGTADTINRTVDDGGRVFVVGTSAYKCLESACRGGRIMPGNGSSSVFIAPPYDFGFKARAFITNFHLPRSSVLLLTCAFAGKERLFKAYEEAVERSYRFYSFGDA
ncbi:MAG: tRNA preQ1(34) S-adenosylmethionine ribosyltransferase-isomerase QueA, partial [Thermoplasmata archaeon]|nr:tRNA preQ1(34) S-adenosylmethionine ribosyltransferase-isomerase QueA [Thermoplasmata archaeon]